MMMPWLLGGFAAFFAIMLVRAYLSGKKEAALLERVFANLQLQQCPACARAYGAIPAQPPHVVFLPDPPFEDSSCQNYWQLRCPACDHVAVVGLPAGVETFVFIQPPGTAPK
jgi:hypothetical protein